MTSTPAPFARVGHLSGPGMEPSIQAAFVVPHDPAARIPRDPRRPM
jgi:hypothetical protein